jgi:hypothetical protein
LTQSQARYHIQELLKCLQHAGPETEEGCAPDIEDNSDAGSEDEDEQGESGKEDGEEALGGSLKCPLMCEQQMGGSKCDSWKSLARHFATRTVPNCSS